MQENKLMSFINVHNILKSRVFVKPINLISYSSVHTKVYRHLYQSIINT